jgi:hypothetical protein
MDYQIKFLGELEKYFLKMRNVSSKHQNALNFRPFSQYYNLIAWSDPIPHHSPSFPIPLIHFFLADHGHKENNIK